MISGYNWRGLIYLYVLLMSELLEGRWTATDLEKQRIWERENRNKNVNEKLSSDKNTKNKITMSQQDFNGDRQLRWKKLMPNLSIIVWRKVSNDERLNSRKNGFQRWMKYKVRSFDQFVKESKRWWVRIPPLFTIGLQLDGHLRWMGRGDA